MLGTFEISFFFTVGIFIWWERVKFLLGLARVPVVTPEIVEKDDWREQVRIAHAEPVGDWS